MARRAQEHALTGHALARLRRLHRAPGYAATSEADRRRAEANTTAALVDRALGTVAAGFQALTAT
ncbi:MAG: hypothetical protein M1826_001840 [Phylliscum demangeonii]|nr:MAG: hypothetical protein M1826_001840 [Phylliscum demangeonii]